MNKRLDFYDAEILLEECDQRSERLKQENAALWAFVRADDAMQEHDRVCQGAEPYECQPFGEAVVVAREALRKYEEPQS